MRRLHVLAPFVAAAVLAAPLHAQAADERAVRAVVETYLHGLKFNDVASFKKAFWPEAKLFWVRNDTLIGQLTQADWYKGFASSAGKEEEGDLKVTAVDVTGNVASAKVVESYPKSVYIDYVSLLRVKGRWWIVNKVYTSRAR